MMTFSAEQASSKATTEHHRNVRMDCPDRRHAILVFAMIFAISVGMHSPADEPQKGTFAGEWWSLKPLHKSVPPDVASTEHAGWVRTPVDQFILAKLIEQRLTPSPPADKRTLLRRVMFDLVGLPPTRA